MKPRRHRRALPLAQLVERATCAADEVRAELHSVHADPDERWHVRLHHDDDVDVWLISWTQEQGTQLHGHGGSSGAFTVVSGELEETVWDPAVREADGATRSRGDVVAFGPGYVHDVRNVLPGTAVSVHVYSPPLERMDFFDVEPDGDGSARLVRLAHVWTDDPEIEAPARDSRQAAS
ncbi:MULTISPECIES: cysteine dioxygenase family protein [unclassified Aeromicrobium]|jgi:predicted metal-dependent enzyme (double-stranded beta helix superfamily)|uniref:cysteine dioxygenase n=1 Tax=unclassified Aeromicrobium TaxID=2633570 RepID=UPI00288C5BB6|nr:MULTISPECIES: cysteine dioxygenase family protein [unclassified Aeromicrobium]